MDPNHSPDEVQDWKPESQHDPITDNIEERLHVASEIETAPAEIEDIDSYEERINYYKSKSYTYIPILSDDKYYNTEEGWLRDISVEQYIYDGTHLMEVLRRLQRQPFLLVDPAGNRPILVDKEDKNPKVISPSEDAKEKVENGDAEVMSLNELRQDYPELVAEAESEYNLRKRADRDLGIITLADLNRRGVRVMIYVVISGLVSKLSRKIEDKYSNSESIFKHLRPATIGRWHKDRIEGLEIHVAEHMNLLEVMQVIQASDNDFVRECGFDSKDHVTALNSINEIRNSVMHANRSLVYDRRDIGEILEAINQSQEIIGNMK